MPESGGTRYTQGRVGSAHRCRRTVRPNTDYLFLTFDTSTPLAEQWRGWLARVKRASSVLVAESPLGPFRPFSDRPTLPEDMMTFDGTLWVEDGVPRMVFCHVRVQIVVGTVAKVRPPDQRVRVFEMEDTGDTVRIRRPFPLP